MAFDYSKYDFDELVQEVTTLVQSQGLWTDAFQSSSGQVLIQTIAFLVDQLHYMLERRTAESFLTTASLPTSVGAIANLLGYRPRRPISSRGTLTLTLGSPALANLVIPKYTQIDYDGTIFVVEEEVTLTLGNDTVTIPVMEGVPNSLTFDTTSLVDANAITLRNNNYVLISNYETIEDTSFWIYSDQGQEFNDVRTSVNGFPPIDALSFATSTDEAFDIRITNDGISLLFGNGTNGEKPIGNLTIEWIESLGSDVEVLTTGNTFLFDDVGFTRTLVTDTGANTYTYTLTNTTVIDGGKDIETIVETKNFAPDYVRTGARAVTANDYEFWVKNSDPTITDIVAVRVYGEQEKNTTITNMNNVYITYLTDSGDELTQVQLQSLRDAMDNYKSLTTMLVFESAKTIPVEVTVNAKRSGQLSASDAEVYTIIRTEMENFFAFDSDSLGRTINKSEILDHFHDLTVLRGGVQKRVFEYVDISMKALFKFTSPYERAQIDITYGNDLDVYDVDLNGVQFQYTAQVGDTADDVATGLAAVIDADANYVATATSNSIEIVSETPGTNFTIADGGSTTPGNLSFSSVWYIPLKELKNPDALNYILPSSVDLIKETNTATITYGSTGNVYQINVDGVAYSYTAKQNLATFSEQIDNAAWTKSEVTITADASADPLSGSTADKVIMSINTTTHQVERSFSVTAGQSYVSSIYMKAGELTTGSLLVSGTLNGTMAKIDIDLNTGLPTATTGTVDIVADVNGWYRVYAVVQPTQSESVTMAFRPHSGTTATGNGSDGMYVWGAQWENSTSLGTYVQAVGSVYQDDADSVALALQTAIDASSLLSATVASNVITIWSDVSDNDILVTNTGTTIAGNLAISVSFATIDSDDGAGSINGGTIDYTTGKVVTPLLSDGYYYFRYSQDAFGNLKANDGQALELSKFKSNFTGTNEYLSTITFI